MKAEIKYKFPCGMEYEQKISGWDLIPSIEGDLECPLHGKKCKPIKEV